LQRLIADAAAGKVARLFVYKFDRLGRAAATHAIVRIWKTLALRLSA
jgi:DNA invertase Pin-like site-specific DNA recombinase